MTRFISTMIIIIVSGCSMPPIDNHTPIWSKSNRYAIEFETKDNHSIGITGKAFRGKIGLDYLKIPMLCDGVLFFESSMCDDFSTATSYSNDTSICWDDIYTNDKFLNCSFEVTQKLTVSDKWNFDNVMKGRVFIKVISDNKYFQLLKMKIKNEDFEGVSWHQLRFLQNPPKLEIETRGNSGKLQMFCGDEKVRDVDYTSQRFDISLENLDSCDYEIVATNKDHYAIEFGTFIFEKQKQTIDLAVPKTYIKKDERYFEFMDRNTKNEPVVVLSKVNNISCFGNRCSGLASGEFFIVKGYTVSGRVFYGKFTPKTEAWEIK